MEARPDGEGSSLVWGLFVFAVLAAFAGWIAYRTVTRDASLAAALAVVERRGPVLDDAFVGLRGCPETTSCRDALSRVRTAASGYEDDLGSHSVPCDDQANGDLWDALNRELETVADAQANLDRTRGTLDRATRDAFAFAEAERGRAESEFAVHNVCREPSAPDAGG